VLDPPPKENGPLTSGIPSAAPGAEEGGKYGTTSKVLPNAGAVGNCAIYTESLEMIHIIRKVLLRQIAITNYVNPF
jgi:hypothetical protein